MHPDKALASLGLEPGADADEIERAYEQKVAQAAQKVESAPTDALKQKFAQLQSQLSEARNVLLSARGQAEQKSSHGTGPSLSETKLADLPNAGPAGGEGEAAQLAAGTVLAGRYEIKQQIGAGGMGAVYHAYDRSKEEDIALKVVLPSLMQNERAKSRFMDEARISARLSHPHIVNVFDVQQDDQALFLTMELLEGQDLRALMESRQLSRQDFSEAEAKQLAQTLCEALAYAHQHTVHRDLKPENIWVTEEGEYKIMDFGIARVMSNSQRTQTGMAMGTAYYMAPEQLKGTAKIDGRADQYALGALLYELLTGDVPAGRIKPLREKRKDISRGFAAAVDKALEPDPEERYPDMVAFAKALESRSGGISLAALVPGKKVVATAAVLLVLVFAGGGLVAAGGSSGLGALLADLLPMSEEQHRALQADAVRLQGQVNTLARRLENGRRNLDSDLRDAERNDSDDVAGLQRWQEAVERNLFSGSLISELEGERAVAEALLRDDDYEPAIASFRKARDGYEKALAEFRAAEHLHRAEQNTIAARAAWDERQENYGLDAPQTLARSEAHRGQARELERTGELAAALDSWRDAERSLRELMEMTDKTVADMDAQRKERARAAALARQRKAAEQVTTVEDARDFLAKYPTGPVAQEVRNREYSFLVSRRRSYWGRDGEKRSTRYRRYRYDAAGYLASERHESSDGDWRDITYEYDPSGNVVSTYEKDNDGRWWKVTYQYDESGNQVFKRIDYYDGDWSETTYKYDASGNRVFQRWKSDSGRSSEVTYRYDRSGKRVFEHEKDIDGDWSETTYKYDESGNRVSKLTKDEDGGWSQSTFRYDASGNKVFERYETDSGRWTETTYKYDESGRRVWEAKKYNSGGRAEVSYAHERSRVVY